MNFGLSWLSDEIQIGDKIEVNFPATRIKCFRNGQMFLDAELPLVIGNKLLLR